MKLFNSKTTVPGMAETFSDWHEAENEAAARAMWADECKRNGLPATATATFTECDPKTLKPVQA